MTDLPQQLDAWLEEWKEHTLPERLPDLDAWIPEPSPLGPAYWEVMRRIWTGATWRRHLESSRVLRDRTAG